MTKWKPIQINVICYAIQIWSSKCLIFTHILIKFVNRQVSNLTPCPEKKMPFMDFSKKESQLTHSSCHNLLIYNLCECVIIVQWIIKLTLYMKDVFVYFKVTSNHSLKRTVWFCLFLSYTLANAGTWTVLGVKRNSSNRFKNISEVR